MTQIMGTTRRTTRLRPPVLRLEELSRRDVWNAAPVGDPFAPTVVYDLAVSVPLPADPVVWRTVTFITADGVSHPADLTVQGNQLTGRWDQDFSLANAVVVTIRVTDMSAAYVQFRELPVQVAPVTNPPPNTNATDSVLSFGRYPLSSDTTLGTLSIMSSRPILLTPGAVSFGTRPPGSVNAGTAAPPVVAIPPVPVTPPPGGAQQVPPLPAAEPPPVAPPPPPRVEPPRPAQPAVTPLLFASSQLDHAAGAYVVSTAVIVRDFAIAGPVVSASAVRVSDRATVVPWTTPYGLFAVTFASDFDSRERVRSDAPGAEPMAGRGSDVVRTDSRTAPAVPSVEVQATVVEEIVVVGKDQTLADVVLLRLAARPLPVFPPADTADREKKPSRLLSAFTVLVMSGVCVQRFRSRSGKAPAERAAGEWLPPLI